jgi:prolyl oligopeptidase
MLRYHLFDNGHIWTDEFGNADNRADFPSLLAYSPYHAVRNGTAYPATLTVAGDGDQVCNALHARKMVARLQHASSSGLPVLLDYSSQRGHSPALPLATRINALTDRLAFLSCALELPG